MILQTAPLSPSQNAAIDAVGRELQPVDNTLGSGGVLRAASAQERQQAAEQMRYQLYLLDRSQRRMSIEDCIAALMDSPGASVPD
ncbi:MAG TPA: hypothetical protein VGG85_08385 [Terracidiphilus sp.]|jgi:hypothetical protein